ncbi:hypothetical protein [uncultured Nitrospira sp.]
MTKNLLAYEFKEEAVKQVSLRLITLSRIAPGPVITFLSCVVLPPFFSTV